MSGSWKEEWGGYYIMMTLHLMYCTLIKLNKPDLPAQEVNSSGLTACPGDMLSFTCETRDSPILVWQSDYYIGIGGELLELLSILPVGTKLYKNSNAIAELTNTSHDNGTWIIVSRLNITVLPSIVLYKTILLHVLMLGLEQDKPSLSN